MVNACDYTLCILCKIFEKSFPLKITKYTNTYAWRFSFLHESSVLFNAWLLPDPWMMALTSDRRRYYFYNTHLRQSQFNFPQEATASYRYNAYVTQGLEVVWDGSLQMLSTSCNVFTLVTYSNLISQVKAWRCSILVQITCTVWTLVCFDYSSCQKNRLFWEWGQGVQLHADQQHMEPNSSKLSANTMRDFVHHKLTNKSWHFFEQKFVQMLTPEKATAVRILSHADLLGQNLCVIDYLCVFDRTKAYCCML